MLWKKEKKILDLIYGNIVINEYTLNNYNNG